MEDNRMALNSVYDSAADSGYGSAYNYDLRQFLSKFLDSNKSVLAADSKIPYQENMIKNFIDDLRKETNKKAEKVKKYATFWESQNKRMQEKETFTLFEEIKKFSQQQEGLRISKQPKAETKTTKPVQVPHSLPALPGPSTACTVSLVGTASASGHVPNQIDLQLEKIQRQKDTITAEVRQLNGQIATWENEVSWRVWNLGVSISQHVADLKDVLGNVLLELRAFNEDQRTWNIGRTRDKSLNKIDEYLNRLLNYFQELETSLFHYEKMCRINHLQVTENISASTAYTEIKRMRAQIRAHSFFFAKQPQQIMRTTVKTSNGGVLKLLSPPWPNIPTEYISTDVVLANRKAAWNISNGTDGYDILGEDVVVLYSDRLKGSRPSTQHTKAKPQTNIQLENTENNIYKLNFIVPTIARNAKWGEQIAEPFWLCVRFTIGNEMFTALSLPIWIVSHPDQKPEAWANMLWQQCFPLEQGMDYRLDVPDKMHCSFIVDAISYLCGCLTDDQKAHLGDLMLHRDKIPGDVDGMITKSQFCESHFSSRAKDGKFLNGKINPKKVKKLAIGEWLYYIIAMLNQKNMGDCWSLGYIVGFIGRKELLNLLKTLEPKSFVIRFPENWADCIEKRIYKQTFTSVEDLKKHQLKDLILGSIPAKWLYLAYQPQNNVRLVDKRVAFEGMGQKLAAAIYGGNGYFRMINPHDWSEELELSDENFPRDDADDDDKPKPNDELWNIPGSSGSFLSSFNIPTTSVYPSQSCEEKMLTSDEKIVRH